MNPRPIGSDSAHGAEASTDDRWIQAEALDHIVERLEVAAAELRSGDLQPERAAALVDDCARLAAEAGAQLDREVRAAGSGPPGQLALEP